MKNIELLCYGISHIAMNHGFQSDVDYDDSGEVCIIGGCNVPTLCDVQMLCEDVKLPATCIEAHDYGIEVFIDENWLEGKAKEAAADTYHFWKRSSPM